MTGLAIIGGININNVAFLLMGQYDIEIKCAFFYSYLRKNASSVEELEIPEVLEPLRRLKDMYRREVQDIFSEAAKQDRAELLAKLKNTNMPHEMGTVSEIAAKYNISKSEVRRRKADGTLHELVAA